MLVRLLIFPGVCQLSMKKEAMSLKKRKVGYMGKFGGSRDKRDRT